LGALKGPREGSNQSQIIESKICRHTSIILHNVK
jgi:hypothetical protein